MTQEDTEWASGVVHDLASQIRKHSEDVRFVIAVMRDSMLTPAESQARWQAIEECEAAQ